MKPILLKGHTRALTKIKYNRDGDLLFSTSKDPEPCVWFSHNGERLGTFEGHSGTVWDVDVSHDSRRLLTASADSSCRLWDVYTGKCLFKFTLSNAARCVAFAEGSRKALFVTDSTMGKNSTLHVVEIAEDPSQQEDNRIGQIEVPKGLPKITAAAWGDLNETIVTGHDDGSIHLYDGETFTLLDKTQEHSSTIMDIQFNKQKSYFISASKDFTARIFDGRTLQLLKTFTTERNVNAAAISPIRPHIILGGGQEAIKVTTTGVKQGKFETRFFHKIFQEEIGRVKGHFGPIHTLAFHPDGKSFASGSEDGFIRLHTFDADYFNFAYPEDVTEYFAM